MAMGWRNIHAPDISSGANIQKNAFDQMLGALDTVKKTVDDHRAFKKKSVADELLKRGLGYTDPDQFQQAIQSGSIYEGLDQNQIDSNMRLNLLDQLAASRQRQVSDIAYKDMLDEQKTKEQYKHYGDFFRAVLNPDNEIDSKTAVQTAQKLGIDPRNMEQFYKEASVFDQIAGRDQARLREQEDYAWDSEKRIIDREKAYLGLDKARREEVNAQVEPMVANLVAALESHDPRGAYQTVAALYQRSLSNDPVASAAIEQLRQTRPNQVTRAIQYFGGQQQQKQPTTRGNIVVPSSIGDVEVNPKNGFTNVGRTKEQIAQDPNIWDLTMGEAYDYGWNVARKQNEGKLPGTNLGSSAMGPYQQTGSNIKVYAPKVLGKNWRDQPVTYDALREMAKLQYNDTVKAGKNSLADIWEYFEKSPIKAYHEKDGLKGVPFEDIEQELLRGESSTKFLDTTADTNRAVEGLLGDRRAPVKPAEPEAQAPTVLDTMAPKNKRAITKLYNEPQFLRVAKENKATPDEQIKLVEKADNLVNDSQLNTAKERLEMMASANENRHKAALFIDTAKKTLSKPEDNVTVMKALKSDTGLPSKVLKDGMKLAKEILSNQYSEYLQEHNLLSEGTGPERVPDQLAALFLRQIDPKERLIGKDKFNKKQLAKEIETTLGSLKISEEAAEQAKETLNEFEVEYAGLNNALREYHTNRIISGLQGNTASLREQEADIAARYANVGSLVGLRGFGEGSEGSVELPDASGAPAVETPPAAITSPVRRGSEQIDDIFGESLKGTPTLNLDEDSAVNEDIINKAIEDYKPSKEPEKTMFPDEWVDSLDDNDRALVNTYKSLFNSRINRRTEKPAKYYDTVLNEIRDFHAQNALFNEAQDSSYAAKKIEKIIQELAKSERELRKAKEMGNTGLRLKAKEEDVEKQKRRLERMERLLSGS